MTLGVTRFAIFLLHTLVHDSSRMLLWNTFVGHSCETCLWDTLVGHSYGALLSDTLTLVESFSRALPVENICHKGPS